MLSSLVSVRLIIDANIAIRDLRWMVKSRRNPDALPDTIEISQTGLVELYAPLFLATEVNKYIPTLARESNKEVGWITALWEEYRVHLNFVDTNYLPPINDGRELRDPKDISYIQLQQHFQHPILTRNIDIAAMGGHVVSFVVTQRLKSLYRANAVEYQFAIAGHIALAIGSPAIEALASKIRSGFTLLKNAPPWFYLGLAFVLISILLNPYYKERIATFFSGFIDNAPALFEEIADLARRAFEPYNEAKTKAAEALRSLPPELLHQPQRGGAE